MNYELLKDLIDLISEFEKEHSSKKESKTTLDTFKKWVAENYSESAQNEEPYWEGKENGRSLESVISTLILHMNRYAKSYSKAAIYDSEFSSQDDFVYLINLKVFGQMSKMDLIKRNIHEKPVGIQIINRLILKGWVAQTESTTDKRSKVLNITDLGNSILEKQMYKIRNASLIVTGDLTRKEKMDLIRLLNKLNDFHRPIYDKNINPQHLLQEVLKNSN